MIWVWSALIGYFFGSLQTAYFVGRMVRKIDIRQYGSTNAGASNVASVIGLKWGVLVGALDIAKAAAAVLLIKQVYPDAAAAFYAGAFAIIGHIFPFYLGFRGGKGVACLIGAALAMNPLVGLLLAGAIVVLTVVTDYIAIGSVTIYTLFPIALYTANYPQHCIALAAALTVVAFCKHTANFARILNGQEVGLRAVLAKEKARAGM